MTKEIPKVSTLEKLEVSDLNEKTPIIKEIINKRSFTPILGTCAATVDRGSDETWQLMIGRITGIWRSLGTRDKEFLSSLLKGKNIELDENIPWVPDVDPKLATLIKALVELSSEASTVFGQSMQSISVDNPAYFSIVVQDLRSINTLKQLFLKACEAAYQVDSSLKYFEKDLICKRIIDLASKFLTPKEFPQYLLVDQHNGDKRISRVNNRLYLYELEWLSELIYYSVSFDGRFYLTSDELSFRVSLNIGSINRKPGSAYIFEKMGEDLTIDTLRNWVTSIQQYRGDKGFKNKQPAFALYDVISRILINQSTEWRNSEKSSHSKTGIPPAVAFSFGLDNELELALMKHGVSTYHVAFPVKSECFTDAKKTEFHVHWIIATKRRKKSDREDVYKTTWDWFTNEINDTRIDGPILVEYNGSILHDLPAAISAKSLSDLGCSDCESIKPLVFLSETDHYTVNLYDREYPDMLSDVMKGVGKTRRSFFFIGLTVSEWWSRLRISDFIFPGNERCFIYETDRNLITINENFDEYQSQALSSWGVHRWRGQLKTLTSVLENCIPKPK